MLKYFLPTMLSIGLEPLYAEQHPKKPPKHQLEGIAATPSAKAPDSSGICSHNLWLLLKHLAKFQLPKSLPQLYHQSLPPRDGIVYYRTTPFSVCRRAVSHRMYFCLCIMA